MIELKITKDNEENNIIISKSNGILFREKMELYDFYSLFEEKINNKSDEISIVLGNKKIDSKNFSLINLIDLVSIYNNLKYKKGSCLYEYLELKVENDFDYILEEINIFLEGKFNKLISKIDIDIKLELNNTLFKVFNSNFDISTQIKDVNEKIELLVKEIISKNISKTYIIFLDSNFINVDFSTFDNVYIFDVNKLLDFTKYNLLLNDGLKIFNIKLLLEQIKREWPVNYVDNEIETYLPFYFSNFFNLPNIKTNDYRIACISKIISNNYKIKQKCLYSNSNKNEVIESFLTKV